MAEYIDQKDINWEEVIKNAPEGATHVDARLWYWRGGGVLDCPTGYEKNTEDGTLYWCHNDWKYDDPDESDYKQIRIPYELYQNKEPGCDTLEQTITRIFDALADADTKYLGNEGDLLYTIGEELDKLIKSNNNNLSVDELIMGYADRKRGGPLQ